MNSIAPALSDRNVVVVSATDDHYAMPLAVTIRSALDRLSTDRRMQLYVLDGGLNDDTKARLLRSWSGGRLSVEWIRPDMDQVGDLMISHQVNLVTYLRLLMPIVLPVHVTRAIYLDADMLVRRDLGRLWDEDQGPHAVLAVPDAAAPYVDASAMLPSFEKCRAYLGAHAPIANYRELGLSADARYFNGGLLVADLAQWRREQYGEKMLACLREHRRHVLWWDQYALNVVLAGKWRTLDDRWNQGAHVFAYPNWSHSPFDRATFTRLQTDPWIVHFCSPSKPWHYFCHHPFQREFYRSLDRTDWKGWRPARPDDYLRLWWNHHYLPLRSEWKRRVRAVKQVVRSKRRRAA
jgi:lipopolysaccharide biosynthesis glycosyltransferase